MQEFKPRCLWLPVLGGAGVLTLALFAGCAVGPDFRPPAAPAVPGYTATALPERTAGSPGKDGVAQRLMAGREIPATWWTLFHCEGLDRLIRLALDNSPTLAAARATLRQAQEERRAQLGALFPQVDAGFTAQRSKISGAGFGQPNNRIAPFTLYNASVSVSYGLDIFGGARRELEALQAEVDYQRYQAEGAYLSLSANVVTAAVQEAALRAQLRATRQILDLEREQLSLIEARFTFGAASEVELALQRAQIAQIQVSLPPLEKALSQTRHLLAVLAGQFPSEAAGLPEFDLEALQLPAELPVSLPSALVHQRPDILAAEGLFHAACARVGVATANLYPQITLSGSLGSEAIKVGSLFGSGSAVWSLGAGVVQPVVHGGQLRARRRAVVAAYEQAGAQYRATVLQAFQEVADVLQALDKDAAALTAQSEARPRGGAVPLRRRGIPGALGRGPPVPAGAGRPGQGARRTLRRQRRPVPCPGGRLVEPSSGGAEECEQP